MGTAYGNRPGVDIAAAQPRCPAASGDFADGIGAICVTDILWKFFWRSRADFARAWCARSKSSSVRSRNTAPPVYVRHEIVHNKYVVESLKNKGAIFVEDLSEVPADAVTVFSAHGVARSVEEEAAARGLPVLNATCPLVTKVHNQGKRYISKGRHLILIGHAGHPEVEGTMGQIPSPVLLVQDTDDVAALTLPADTPVAYITQTTLSVDDTKDIIAALQARFTDIQGPDIRDICYATQNRQSAVRDLIKLVDVILVVGAANSSNSNRLREIGTEVGVASYLIADGSELNPDWLKDAKAVGITAGASAPEVLVDDVIEALRRIGPVKVSVLPGREENIEFRLPAELTAVG